MNYRSDKYQNKLSVLGYGCMRLPGKMGKIDLPEAERLILRAIEQGVNYFDTAYIYPGSEAALGEILHRHGLRDKVNIATKLPHYLIKDRATLDKLFSQQLSRLQTDHIDYYLMHMLNDTATWERLKQLGIEEWIAEKKAAGQIGQIGFSYHGNSSMFCSLCDAYPWEFCLIQYNYLDEHSQAGRKGLQHAHRKGVPVMIMEPLRGGRLTRLPEEAKKRMAAHRPAYTPAQWSFRWLWNQKEVTVVLSGMNNASALEDNLATAAAAKVGELTPADQAMLQSVVQAINSTVKVGCTGCGYCLPCPKQVDIPGIFSAYNRLYTDNRFTGLKEYFMCTALRKNATGASNCIGCRKCEQHCPQGIPISQELKEAKAKLEGPLYKMGKALAKRFVKF